MPEWLQLLPQARTRTGTATPIHVWPNGEEPESEASYDRMIKLGVDGYMASEPGRLHAFLCAQEIPRPDGTDRCPTSSDRRRSARRS